MRNKILLSLALMILVASADAQKMDFWLDAGLKVQTGFTSLYNANATNGDLYDFTLANSTKIGGKLGFNWNYVGITFDVMMGKHKGTYQDLTTNTDREISVQTTDLYLLFRNSRNKGYFEIGPKMSIIGDVRSGGEGFDAFYESNNLGAVLGFGTYILGPEDGRFSGILGLRFEYGFQDLANADGMAEGAGRVPVPYTGEAGTTHPIFAGIVFECNWGIGGVGQARCGERSKFIWF